MNLFSLKIRCMRFFIIHLMLIIFSIMSAQADNAQKGLESLHKESNSTLSTVPSHGIELSQAAANKFSVEYTVIKENPFIIAQIKEMQFYTPVLDYYLPLYSLLREETYFLII